MTDNSYIAQCGTDELPRRIPGANMFEYYVCYNEYGGIMKRVPRDVLDRWLYEFEVNNQLALGVWELQRGHGLEVYVRISPIFELDNKDNNWQSWNYTFVPDVR